MGNVRTGYRRARTAPMVLSVLLLMALVLPTTAAAMPSSVATGPRPGITPVSSLVGKAFVTPTPALPTDPEDWLAWLNYYRAVGNEPPVTENGAWTAGQKYHAQYLVDWATSSESCSPGFPHCETASNPHYSAAGNTAGASSNIERSSDPAGETAKASIEGLMTAPFHGMGFIDPRLTQSAYGSYLNPAATGAVKYAALVDVLRGRGSDALFPGHAVGWPANNTVVPLTSYKGNESPDPLSFVGGSDCSGYAAPTGLPILVQFPPGVDPVDATATLTTGGVAVPHCVVTTKDYGTGSQQQQLLSSRNVLMVLPKVPLVPGQTYTYSVTNQATNALTSSFTVVSVPGAPGEGTVTEQSGHMHITWTAPTSTGALPLNGYTLVIEPNGGGLPVSTVHVGAGVTAADVTGLSAGVVYIVLVAAGNAAGLSDLNAGFFQHSAAFPQSNEAPAIPDPPTGVGGTAQIAVTWKAPVGTGGTPITGYVVTPYQAGVAQTPYLQSGTGTSHTFTGLSPSTAYTFRVAAVNAIGTSPASDPSALITTSAAPGPPAAPTALTVTGGNQKATLHWSAPVQNGGASLNGYVVTPRLAGVAQPPVVFPSTATTQDITGLVNGTAYSFTVAARNPVGTGPPTPASGLVVPPFASPTAFLQRASTDLLGRAPTATELTAQLAALDAGTIPAATILGLRRSTDATTNVDPITRLYSAYFLRIPDAGGLNYWIGRRRAGTSVYTASDNFAASGEFKTRYGSLTNQQFVNLVYTNVLGRSGDAGGVSYWTSQLDSKAKTRGQVMVGFSESPEYRTLEGPAVDVAVSFISLLGVAPSQSEFDTWVGGLKGATATVTSLEAALLADSRYAARVA